MSSHHRAAKKKKVTRDEISLPSCFKGTFEWLWMCRALQGACRVVPGSPGRLTEDRAVWGETKTAWPVPRGVQGLGCWVREALWQ